MAARVDVASGEVGQAGDAGVKPEPGPKPCLIPKPFSLQRNTTFRSILAPKTLTTTPQQSQTTPTTSSKPEPCQPISAPVSDSSSVVKLDAESTTIPELTNALEAPSAITPQTESTHTTEQNQTALSTSLTTPTSEPLASTTSDQTGTSEANQVSLSELDEHGPSDTGHSAAGTEAVPSPSVTSTPLQPQSENTVSEPTPAVVRRHAGKDQAAHLGGGRKRLSMELTSRFESASLSLPSQPPANQEREQVTKRETAVPKVSVLRAKEEEKVTDSPGSPSDPECRLKHSTPLKEERDGEGVKEEGEKKGSSIQRRISLLLDSSSRPEALTNREEVPRPMKQAVSSGGVKQRIKDWAADTPPVQASNQRVDVAPQPFPVRVHPVLSVTGGLLATSKSVQLAPREDKASTLLHAGHSGIEDEEEEDEEEEEEEEGEKEEDEVPLYKTVEILLGQEDGGKKQELVVDQIGKEMEAKVKEEEKLAEVDKLKQLELEERQAEDERERERQKVVERERERQREEEERKRKEEEERKRQREMEREMKRQRQREEERDRERQREEEERKRKEEEERERQIELERERERQREEEERKREEEKERERQIELERERERQREEEERNRKEEERKRQREMEREMKRQRDEEERERKRKEEERERQIELEKEKARQREEEERERKRKEEEERERQIELEKERERQREEEERERKRKEEEERERQREMEREMKRQREEERDRERQRDEEERERKRKEEKERERQIELEKERERQREEEERERKRKEEEERERQREMEREIKRQRQREEEKERERQKDEEERERNRKEEERERQIELEKERERQREEEERERKIKEEEGERPREVEREKERQVEEGKRGKLRMKEERLREKEREKLKEKEREMEIQREEERMQEDEIQREEEREKEEAESPIQFITLKPDQPPKPEPPSPSTTVPIIKPIPKEEKQPHIEVVYDDFSVKEEKPLIKMVYDDFSVKPRRWGSQARFLADRAQVKSPSPETEEPESLGSSESDLQRTVVDTQEPAQESPVSVEPHPAERDLEGGVPTPKDGTENKKEKKKKEEEKYKEEGTSMDTEEDQLKCYVGAEEGRDTEALIGGEPDKQYGGCDTRLSEDDCPQTTEDQISPVITPDEPDSTSPLEETEDQISPVITPDEPDSTSPLEETEDQISPVITPDELDSTSPLEETEDPLPFPDISAPLLDTSVLRARAELRKSRRTRPPRAFRQSSTTIMLEEDPVHDWRFYDSSDKLDSLIRGDCESDEEQPRGREFCSQPSQPQRIALFSGMDPSALKAQLKKRGGGGAGGGEGVDTDHQTDRLAPSPSQLSCSPRRSSFLPGASRVLPPVGNKGARGDKSPSWLRELKSKMRSSQYNSEA